MPGIPRKAPPRGGMRRQRVQASVTNPDMLKDIAKKFGGEYKKAGGVNGLYQAVEFNQDGNRVTVAPFEQVKQGKLVKSYLNVTIQLNTDSDSDDEDEDNSDSFKIDLIKDAGLESNEYQSCETTILNVMGKSSKRILGLISALAQQSVDVQSSLKGGNMRRRKVQAGGSIGRKKLSGLTSMCIAMNIEPSDVVRVAKKSGADIVGKSIFFSAGAYKKASEITEEYNETGSTQPYIEFGCDNRKAWLSGIDGAGNYVEMDNEEDISLISSDIVSSGSFVDFIQYDYDTSTNESKKVLSQVKTFLKELSNLFDDVATKGNSRVPKARRNVNSSPNFDEESSLKGGKMRVLSRAQAQRKLLALAGIRKVTQSLIALAEADEDEQDDLQEEVQDAVEELLENPSDDIEEAIEDITSAMKRNHRVVSGEDDAFYDEDIVDLSEADEDEDEDLEDDVVESRFRSRKVQSRMKRKRNVMAELDEEFDGAYADDITDESDLDEDIYDEDSYEEVSSSRRRNRPVSAKTRTAVKSSKTKRKATASIVAANLAALRNM